MRAIAIGSLFGLLLTIPALAALPPQYQRQRELLAIINDTSIIDAIGSSGIEAIELMEPDHYQVRGGTCILDVTIEDLPNGDGAPGPRQFEIVLGAPICQ